MNAEVIRADVVLVGYRLLSTDASKEAFAARVFSEVVEASPAPNLTVQLQPSASQEALALFPRRLRIEKDRITIEIAPDRTTVSMDYPPYMSLDRLCDVVGHAILASDVGDQSLRAFGFNMHLVFNLPEGLTAGQFYPEA